MTEKKTVTINGQDYDAVTGLPVGKKQDLKPAPVASAPQSPHRVPATSLHASPQKSVTLHRKATRRPISNRTAVASPKMARATSPATVSQGASHGVGQHPQIRKFAPHPVDAIRPKKIMDIGRPVAHPHVAKAHARSEAKAQPQPSLTAAVIKEKAIQNAVAETHKPAKRKVSFFQRLLSRQRAVAMLSAAFAFVLFGGYLTYLNMPNLSVRVAAIQAGIDASYPDYRPDGYSLNGPVTYADGRVTMNFTANGGPQEFKISQSESTWDSEAVLDNYIAPRAGADYIPYTERGLTIYTYDNNAAWVNGGILYTIEGNAPLSSEQIRRIATSLL